jgi:hypothetical protein
MRDTVNIQFQFVVIMKSINVRTEQEIVPEDYSTKDQDLHSSGHLKKK